MTSWLLFAGGLAWVVFLVWWVLPARPVSLPDPVSEDWLTQHDQQDR